MIEEERRVLDLRYRAEAEVHHRGCLNRRNLLGGLAVATLGAGAVGEVFLARPETPQGYLETALDLMQRHSIRRNQVDWHVLTLNAQRDARAAKTIVDTYPAIRDALAGLGDRHSAFATAEKMNSLRSARPRPTNSGELAAKRIDDRVGYVSIPTFESLSDDLGVRFAESIPSGLRRVDGAEIAGWIVDLRMNSGGNMWPMLLGLGPLLGNGVLGAFVDADEHKAVWTYEDGVVTLRDEKPSFWERVLQSGMTLRLTGDAYRLMNPLGPVAVLTVPELLAQVKAFAWPSEVVGRP